MAERSEPAAGWEQHAREQRRAWLRTTPQQRLDWLWRTKLFAQRYCGAARRAGHVAAAAEGRGPGKPVD